jgi:hypothetical protein
VDKILKQISKDIKETAKIHGNVWKCISSMPWKIVEHNKHKWTKIKVEFRQSNRYFNYIPL